MAKESVIQSKTFKFSLQIISVYKSLLATNEYVLSRQLLKSATSIGANVEEALAGQSRNDFIAKMSIASKEARETRYWLKLLNASQLIKIDFLPYLKEIDEINLILTSIVKTSQERIPLKTHNSKLKTSI